MADTSLAATLGEGSQELTKFTGYQKFVVAILSFLQFTLILDFMLLSPLGAILMPALKIGPSQFGLVVSVYAFSAGLSGILAAGFADRFDRKRLLLFFYTGFLVGTFLCGIAESYEFLLAARIVTGLFGGVIGSVVFAITTDLFPFSARGRVMGFIQTSFAASQVLGIPFGLFLSNHWNWHAPFLLIVGVGIIAGIVIAKYLRPIDAHLNVKADRNAFHHLYETVTTPRYLQAFATVALLSTGGFMLMPFGSAFSVHNLGIPIETLPMVYMLTGISSIIFGPLIGRAADKFGKFRLFSLGSILTIIMVLIYTNLGVTPISIVVLVSAILFVGVSARMITSQALMSAIPAPQARGSFMAVSSSIQQISGGLAALLAGWIVVEGANGYLENFDLLGVVVATATLITMILMYFIQRMITNKT